MFAWWCLAAVLLHACTAFVLPSSSARGSGFNVRHVNQQQQHKCCDAHRARHQPRAQRLQLYKKKRKDLLDEDDWYGDGRSSNNDDDPDFRYETYSTFDDSFRSSIDSPELSSDNENDGADFKFAMVQPAVQSSYSTEPPRTTVIEAPIYYEFDETLTDETDDFNEEQLQLPDTDDASDTEDDSSSEDDSDEIDYMSDSDADSDSDSDDELLQLVGDYASVGAVLYAGEHSAGDGEVGADADYPESDDQIWGSSSSSRSQAQYKDVFDSFGFDAGSESEEEDSDSDDDERAQPQFELWDFNAASLEFAEGEVDPMLTDIKGVSLVSSKLQEMVDANYKPSSVPRAATYERVLVSAVSTSIERSLESNLQNFGIDCKINFADFEPDVSDTHWSPEQIAAFKARAVYEATGLPCIAESTSFEVESANGGIGRKDARYRLVYYHMLK